MTTAKAQNKLQGSARLDNRDKRNMIRFLVGVTTRLDS